MNPKYLKGLRTYALNALTEKVYGIRHGTELGPLVYVTAPNKDADGAIGGLLVEVDTMKKGLNGSMHLGGRVSFVSTGAADARAYFRMDQCQAVMVEAKGYTQLREAPIYWVYLLAVVFSVLCSAAMVVLWAHDVPRVTGWDLIQSIVLTLLFVLLFLGQTSGYRMRKRLKKEWHRAKKFTTVTVNEDE